MRGRSVRGGMVGIWAMAAAISAMAAASAAAGDPPPQKYVFKESYAEGKQYSVLFSKRLEMDYDVVVRGQTVDHHSLSESSQDKGNVTIQRTRDGVPVAERIEFDASCGIATRTDKGEPAMKHSPVAGKLVTVTRGDDGTPHCDFRDGDYDPRLTQLFRDWLGRDTELYPDRPVAIGEKWDITEKVKSRLHTLGDNDQMLANCTLKSVRQIKGGEIAELAITLACLNKLPGNVYVELQANGTALVDLGTGRVCRVDIAGTMHACGARDYGDATVSATGDGTVEIHQFSAPAAALAAKAERLLARRSTSSASVAQ